MGANFFKIVSVICLFTSSAFAQNPVVNYGNFKASLGVDGKIFMQEGVTFPKGQNKGAFGQSVLWISSINGTDSFVSAVGFGVNETDFQSGPLSLDGKDGEDPSGWSHVWVVDKEVVQNHQKYFKDQNYSMSQDLKDWPVNADAGFSPLLAPFVDWNQNNKYEPTLGDYPYIYGDQMAYTVFNDRGPHGHSGGEGMGLEVQQLSSCYAGTEPYGNLFVNRLVLENRSGRHYPNTILSVNTEVILGNSKDNYIGTHVSGGFMYAYNGNITDSEYGTNVPALLVFPMEESVKLSSTLYMSDDGSVQTGEPKKKGEFLNYANGKWRNGKSVTFGSAGIDGSDSCRFVFSGKTDSGFPGKNWSEKESGSTPGKRVMLMNLSIDSLVSGVKKNVVLGYAILPDFSGEESDLLAFVTKMRRYYVEGRYSSTSDLVKSKPILYPTICKSGEKVKIESQIPVFTDVSLLSLDGKMAQNIGKIEKKYFILKDCLGSGMYVLRLKSANGISTHKLFIQ